MARARKESSVKFFPLSRGKLVVGCLIGGTLLLFAWGLITTPKTLSGTEGAEATPTSVTTLVAVVPATHTPITPRHIDTQTATSTNTRTSTQTQTPTVVPSQTVVVDNKPEPPTQTPTYTPVKRSPTPTPTLTPSEQESGPPLVSDPIISANVVHLSELNPNGGRTLVYGQGFLPGERLELKTPAWRQDHSHWVVANGEGKFIFSLYIPYNHPECTTGRFPLEVWGNTNTLRGSTIIRIIW